MSLKAAKRKPRCGAPCFLGGHEFVCVNPPHPQTPDRHYFRRRWYGERPTYETTSPTAASTAIAANVCAIICGKQDLSGNRCQCPAPQWVPRSAGEGGTTKVAHPTVKPIALMRWLVKPDFALLNFPDSGRVQNMTRWTTPDTPCSLAGHTSRRKGEPDG